MKFLKFYEFIWESGFGGGYFFRNQPIRNKNDLWWSCLLAYGTKLVILIEDLPYLLPTKFLFIWENGFR